MTSTTLLEPSFADLIAAMERAGDIAEDRRRHWTCSIRQLAKWLARPVEGMPARWSAIRFPVGQLHHARLGVTAKILANHRANAKAALRWFSKENDLPQHGVRLRPEWMRLSREIDKRTWQRFSGLARFCSARGIGISDVNDDAFVIYWVYRTETTGLATHDTAKRFMIRAWNACADASEGWDLQRLAEPPLKKPCLPGRRFRSVSGRASTTIWQELAQVHRTLAGKRIEPCKPTTIQYRRAELIAFARMAVRLGIPIEHLRSFAALLHPDVAEKVIDVYWQKNGEEPKTGTIDLGWKVLRMARESGSLGEAELSRLDEIRVALEHHRREGLTPKNLQLIRQVLTEGVWREVASLPNALMQQARAAKDHAPRKAAVLAQHAAAIAIETFAPFAFAISA